MIVEARNGGGAGTPGEPGGDQGQPRLSLNASDNEGGTGTAADVSPLRSAEARTLAHPTTFGNAVRRAIAAIEPWYQWGPYWAERLDQRGDSKLRFVIVEWLGLHIGFTFGRLGPLYPRQKDKAR